MASGIMNRLGLPGRGLDPVSGKKVLLDTARSLAGPYATQSRMGNLSAAKGILKDWTDVLKNPESVSKIRNAAINATPRGSQLLAEAQASRLHDMFMDQIPYPLGKF